jgi:hypothetical protein
LPGFSVALICGDPLGTTDALELVITQLVVPFGVPMPRPTGPATPRAVSVTVTVPAWATVNEETLDPPTVNELEKESVELLDDGLVDENRFPSTPQPAENTTRTRTTRS